MPLVRERHEPAIEQRRGRTHRREATPPAPVASGRVARIRALEGIEGISPERYDPGRDRGTLLAAEHLARYLWAASFVDGKRVLDAACGSGMGSWLLARAGAVDVLGIDLSHDALAQAMEIGADTVRVQHGDVTALRLEDESVDVAVSFETIEHVTEPGRALDELARVLVGDGLLLVSTPPAERSYDSNPHHLYELTRDELENHLNRLFMNVRIVEQSTWYASAVLDASPADGVSTPLPATVHAERQAACDESAYLLAVASNGPLPDPVDGKVVLGNVGGPEGAMRMIGDLGRALEEVNGRQRALERENALLHRRLRESGERHAATLAELGGQLEAARLAVVGMQESSSWRLTRPLRAAKRVLRRS